MSKGETASGPVVYWMSRDQRAQDNWALLYAQESAIELKKPLEVVFCLVPSFLGATIRQYGFMIRALQETEETLKRHQIPLVLLEGNPENEIPKYLDRSKSAILVTDFDPLRVKMKWKKRVAAKVKVPVCEVDAHNIVPCWQASLKQEYAARTIRPKIQRQLPDFLEAYPRIKKHPIGTKSKDKLIYSDKIMRKLTVQMGVQEVDWISPGSAAALRRMKKFIAEGLADYEEKRNDPNASGQSDLSPYLHFGHLSAQRVALAVKAAEASRSAKEAFLEELIVRRELSDNYCYYNPNYESFAGFPEWSRKTLNKHRRDSREYVYSQRAFEHGETHDELWNAAQIQMVRKGKMHGYLRMYWAKKILEWSGTPEEAVRNAIYLNDRYELDGRDPNGYVGVVWSIGGVHDRPWGEREVFGSVRYMSRKGCDKKFDTLKFIRSVLGEAEDRK